MKFKGTLSSQGLRRLEKGAQSLQGLLPIFVVGSIDRSSDVCRVPPVLGEARQKLHTPAQPRRCARHPAGVRHGRHADHRPMGESAASSPIGSGYSLGPLSAPLTAASIQEVLFDLDSYKCSSKHNNLIAFSFEVALLLRVLRSAGATDSDALEVGVHLHGLVTHCI